MEEKKKKLKLKRALPEIDYLQELQQIYDEDDVILTYLVPFPIVERYFYGNDIITQNQLPCCSFYNFQVRPLDLG